MVRFDDRNHLAKPRRAMVARPSSYKTKRLLIRDENTRDRDEWITRLSEEESSQGSSNFENLTEPQRTAMPVLEIPVEQAEVMEMKRSTVNQQTDITSAQMALKAEETFVDIEKPAILNTPIRSSGII